MRFTLKDSGYSTFKKICTGRKWIGRVGKHVDGRYFGKIGSTFIYADTERQAFDMVVAKHCGFEAPSEMDHHNQTVRMQNRARRAQASRAVDQMLAGNFDDIFNIMQKGA